MPSLNDSKFIGYLGRDPEFNTTTEGKSIASFSLAVHEKVKEEQKTMWVKVVVFNRQAEVIAQYLHKGSCVYVSGKIGTEEWVNRSGEKQFNLTLLANRIEFLDTKVRENALSEVTEETEFASL